jgi:DNA-binding NarL/FixJ family response regulator
VQGTKTIRLLLVDDHRLVRAGVRALLGSARNIEVLAETGSGREAVQLAAVHKPDLVLMDVSLRELNGIEAADRIIKGPSGARVVVLSMHAEEEQIARALRVGVSGYVVKDSAPQELESAVRAVMLGETFLSPSISRQIVDKYVLHGKMGLSALTRRQVDVLQLIAEGSGTKKIAAVLGLSVKTVETHKAQLMGRLGIHDIASLVRYAIREGLVTAG